MSKKVKKIKDAGVDTNNSVQVSSIDEFRNIAMYNKLKIERDGKFLYMIKNNEVVGIFDESRNDGSVVKEVVDRANEIRGPINDAGESGAEMAERRYNSDKEVEIYSDISDEPIKGNIYEIDGDLCSKEELTDILKEHFEVSEVTDDVEREDAIDNMVDSEYIRDISDADGEKVIKVSYKDKKLDPMYYLGEVDWNEVIYNDFDNVLSPLYELKDRGDLEKEALEYHRKDSKKVKDSVRYEVRTYFSEDNDMEYVPFYNLNEAIEYVKKNNLKSDNYNDVRIMKVEYTQYGENKKTLYYIDENGELIKTYKGKSNIPQHNKKFGVDYFKELETKVNSAVPSADVEIDNIIVYNEEDANKVLNILKNPQIEGLNIFNIKTDYIDETDWDFPDFKPYYKITYKMTADYDYWSKDEYEENYAEKNDVDLAEDSKKVKDVEIVTEDVTDQVIISKDEYFSKGAELKKQGYKVIWCGDGLFCFAKPKLMSKKEWPTKDTDDTFIQDVEESPLANLSNNIISFPNGDYLYVDYRPDCKCMIAGHATNTGIQEEYTMEYDFGEDVDTNIQRFYDYITEENPDFIGDSKKVKDNKITYQEVLNKMRELGNVDTYIAASNKKVYRIFGDLDTYFYICNIFGFTPRRTDDFKYEYSTSDFDFDWVEEDILLAINNIINKDSKKKL